MKAFFRIALFVLLMLSLVTPAFSAIEGKDKTYSGGRTYALTEEIVRLTGLDVYAPAHALESMGLTKSDEEGLVKIGTYEEVFGDQPLTLKYASDDLSTLMFDNMVCLRNGRLIVTAPSYTRGAEDVYEAFARVMKSERFWDANSRSGMTFSNDGRHALFIDGYTALGQGRYDYQLIILDVEAGEWYLGSSWPRDFMRGGKCVVGACFDETNEYIYIKAYGMSEFYNPNQFMRYHMESGEMEILRTHELWADYTNMFKTPDGSYVHGMKPLYYHAPAGLVVYKEIAGEWFAIPEFFHMRSELLMIRNLDMKGENGQALALSELYVPRPLPEDFRYENLYSDTRTLTNVLSLPVINDGVHALREFILFDKELTQASRVSMHQLLKSDMFSASACFDYPQIFNAALSPDGKYAFVVFGIQPQFQKYSDENCFYARILNTETLEVSCVSFEEGTIGMKSAFANVQSADYPVGIRFIANDLIIINTDDGIRLFRIR